MESGHVERLGVRSPPRWFSGYRGLFPAVEISLSKTFTAGIDPLNHSNHLPRPVRPNRTIWVLPGGAAALQVRAFRGGRNS